jgi:crotonobetainyl-CoA:carnitine CoA-transferase CaiB-like acyl-CoA transferase
MCQTPKFWTLWCDLTGAHLGQDPRFNTIPARRENLAALSDAVDQVMMAKTTSEWLAVLGGSVPFAPVLDIGEALESDYVAHVEMTTRVAHPDTDNGVKTLASPFRVNGQRPVLTRAPKMGEQNASLLNEDMSK